MVEEKYICKRRDEGNEITAVSMTTVSISSDPSTPQDAKLAP